MREPEDEEDDDFGSAGDVPVMNYVYEQYEHSRPLSDPVVPPHCEFEEYFAVAEPQSSLRPKLRIYPRVTELVNKNTERAARCARESKPLHKMIPIRRKIFPVADDTDFSAPRWLNPDFARIVNHKVISETKYR